MNYWVITDTHFGHKKMQEYCGRPEGFETKILHNLIMTCKTGDVLIHLGDICIGQDEHWHTELGYVHARKWLLRGNHDKKSLGWYLDHGWDFVADEIIIDIFGKRVLFSHRPTAECVFDINIHGHHHNTEHHPEDEISVKNKLIFIEHEYKPINLRSIVEG